MASLVEFPRNRLSTPTLIYVIDTVLQMFVQMFSLTHRTEEYKSYTHSW